MPIIELQTVDSTNNYALSLIRAGAMPEQPDRQTGRQEQVRHGLAIFAHEQVAGKGQRGKNWASSKGDGIALSIVINPSPLKVLDQFGLSVCAAVAVRTFFKNYAGDDTKIKWPNDLYWKDRKAGGILIESVIKSKEPGEHSWEWAVIGIGININQTDFPGDLPNPVSLKQITGKSFEPLALARELCVTLDHYYNELITKGIEAIMPAYLSHLYKKDEKVTLQKGDHVFEALIKGVNPNGKLVVQHAIEEQFDHGEIQWIL